MRANNEGSPPASGRDRSNASRLFTLTAHTHRELIARLQDRSSGQLQGGAVRVAMLYRTPDELDRGRKRALAAIQAESPCRGEDGAYYEPEPYGADSVAFLFPGQGSQAPGMLKGLHDTLPGLRTRLNEHDALSREVFGRSLYELVYAASEEGTAEIMTDTRWAQAALGYVSAPLADALQALGVTPSFVAGHSYGELTAMRQAGLFDAATFLRITQLRGASMHEALSRAPGGMAAVALNESNCEKLLEEAGVQLEVANVNTPTQTIVAGELPELQRLAQYAAKVRVRVIGLKAAGAFHSRAVRGVGNALTTRLQALDGIKETTLPLASNRTGEIFARGFGDAALELGRQLESKVRWRQVCASLYQAGARIFVEVGPGRVLSRMVEENLPQGSVVAAHVDPLKNEPRWHTLKWVAQLFVHGVDVSGESWSTPRDQTAPVEPRRQVMREEISMNQDWIARALDRSDELVNRYFGLCQALVEDRNANGERAHRVDACEVLNLTSSVTEHYLRLQEIALGGSQRESALPAAVVDSKALPPSPSVERSPAPLALAQETADFELSERSLARWIAVETGLSEDVVLKAESLADLGVDSLTQARFVEHISDHVVLTPEMQVRLSICATLRDVVRVLAQSSGEVELGRNDEAAKEPAAPLVQTAPLVQAVMERTGEALSAADLARPWTELLSATSMRRLIDELAETDSVVALAGQQILTCPSLGAALGLLDGIRGKTGASAATKAPRPCPKPSFVMRFGEERAP